MEPEDLSEMGGERESQILDQVGTRKRILFTAKQLSKTNRVLFP